MPERERPPGYARNEAKNAEVRATLKPLGEGERPPALIIALVLAILLGVGNLVGYLFADDVPLVGTIVFCAVMAMAAYGLWHARAWAVLGFMALLGIVAVSAALSATVASNVPTVLFCIVLMGVTGTLFWKLVRVLGRIQAPQR